jgi:signal peptidase I
LVNLIKSKKKRVAERPPSDNGGGVGRAIWEQTSTLILAIAIALCIRHAVIEPFRIPSGSMFPTLLIGDHLFVNKFLYGISVPFTSTRLPGFREPQRGEVVVFTVARQGPHTFPADRRPELPREEFVKRLIGLPGDEIDMRRGVLYVNGQAVAENPLDEVFQSPSGDRLDVSQVSLESCSFKTLDDPRRSGPAASWPIRVEEGRYFMLGDNRDHSKDSRVWGTVRLQELKGPAFMLYWSWNFNGGWAEVLNPMTWWSVEKRWGRIGNAVTCDDLTDAV